MQHAPTTPPSRESSVALGTWKRHCLTRGFRFGGLQRGQRREQQGGDRKATCTPGQNQLDIHEG
jgi:hypothetical protein